MVLSLTPIHVFAYVPGKKEDAAFKNMFLHSAVNQRPIATYMYADNTNYFQTAATTATLSEEAPGGLEWMLLTFAIDRNQDGDLLLYKLQGDKLAEALTQGSIELMPNSNLDLEDFLEPIIDEDTPLYLSTRRCTKNIAPQPAPASEWVHLAETFERSDLDEFNFRETPSTMMKEEPIYGHKGEPYVPPTPVPAESQMALLTMETETDATAEPEEVISAASPEREYLTAEPAEEASTPEPVEDLPAIEPEEDAPAAEPETVEPDVEPEDDAAGVEEKEIDYYDGVRFTAPDSNAGPALFSALPLEDDIIRNYMFWDGSLVYEDGAAYDEMAWEDGAYYVIVFQPNDEHTAIYNTFLAFQINAKADPKDLLLNPAEYPGLYFEWPGDPVNLLSGSFSWNYTDFSLYGKHDLPFTRYYESTAYEKDYHYGMGWSSNYTYGLDVDLL